MARKDISDAEVLRVYADELKGAARVALLVERTGQPEKVCYRAMERTFGRGYIEYGVSLRSGWLTAAGRALLEPARQTAAAPDRAGPIGCDLASGPDSTAVGVWDSVTRVFVEQVSGQTLLDWQAHLLSVIVANMSVPPNLLDGIAPAKKQA